MTQNSILITGCSQGLGRELALRFASDNFKVYAISRNAALIYELKKDSKNIIPIVADITKDNDRKCILESLKDEKLNFVIHNAAIANPSMIVNLSEQLLKEHYETNFFAPVLLNQMLISLLKKNSRVLHISSLASELSLPGLMPYCTSKGALEHMTNCFNVEFNSKDIYFANLRPGMVDTKMQEKLRNTDESKLPERRLYVAAKNDNKLKPSKNVAKFVKWVMCDTDNSVFSKKLWDINEKALNSET
jgi:benzil reductase ((S)-benzoin forming)